MKRAGNLRMAQLGPSEIRAMTQACVNAKGVNMAQGVCDTPVPLPVLEGAKRAMDQGFNTYTRSTVSLNCGRRWPRSWLATMAFRSILNATSR